MNAVQTEPENNVLQSHSKEKIGYVNARSFGSKFKRTGKAVGVISKAFKVFSPPFFFFLFPSGIFALRRAAPGAILYCVKVLVLRSGLEA